MITLKYQRLEGFEFVHGSRDCYTLVREFYRDNFGLELTDYARPDDWWDEGLNLYMDNFAKEGFVQVDFNPYEMQPGDLFLSAILSSVPNHASVYLGDGLILHHLPGRLSTHELFAGLVRSNLCACLRHPKAVLPEISEPAVNLLDRAPLHVKEKLLCLSRNS